MTQEAIEIARYLMDLHRCKRTDYICRKILPGIDAHAVLRAMHETGKSEFEILEPYGLRGSEARWVMHAILRER